MIQENKKLKNLLQKAYSKELDDKEIAEYKDRLVKFFNILVEIDQRNKKKADESKNN